MQLEARPARPFSTTRTVKGCSGEIARLSVGAFHDGGELVLARARAYSGQRGYEIAYAGHRLTIEPAMSLRNGYLISEGVLAPAARPM